MNSKIERLLEESKEEYTYETWGKNFEPITVKKMIVNQEKFAELIIEECIEVINDNVEVALSATGNVVFEDELLKTHFGIKE